MLNQRKGAASICSAVTVRVTVRVGFVSIFYDYLAYQVLARGVLLGIYFQKF